VQESEYIEAVDSGSSLTLPFNAREIFLVISGKNVGTLKAQVLVDGKILQEKTISATKQDLYTIFSDESFQNNATLIISEVTP